MNTIKKRANKHILRKLLSLALPVILILGTMAGCEGPQGPEGNQGPQGEQGPVGPAGEDGSIIHAGQGAPAEDIGEAGDFYLNRDTSELYGPKQESGWGTPISLQGPQGPKGDQGDQGPQGPEGPQGPKGDDGQDGSDGQDGEDGSQIHSGTGAPAASLGVVGDYYLDKSSYELYGPKTDSGWGSPLDLKGTANVMYSAWTTLDSAVRDTTIDGSDMKVSDIDAPQLSQEILDQGVVNVYMKFSSDIYPLPYTGYAGSAANVLDFLPRLNTLYITRFTMDNSASVGFNSSLEFRYVIIPGGVAAKQKLSREQIHKMSYQEIKQRFGR